LHATVEAQEEAKAKRISAVHHLQSLNYSTLSNFFALARQKRLHFHLCHTSSFNSSIYITNLPLLKVYRDNPMPALSYAR